jgi:N-acetylglucosamine-6-phosphate deacetylase
VRLRSERIVCPDGTLAGEVVVADGRIETVLPASSEGWRAEGNDELIDLGDRWLIPGFVDVHVHGGGGAQFNTSSTEEVAEAAHFHALHGTTSLVATTVAASVDDLVAALRAISGCTAPNLIGVHLEGPFLNRERPGAMDPDLFLDPDAGELERVLAAGDGKVRVMTFAPELPGAVELIERLVQAGVVASIGHTTATDGDVREAVRAGARSATHLFNGMAPFHHRSPGAVGAALDMPEISCELICDGLHVDPVAMRLVHRLKGAQGLRLVTDAIAAAGMPDGEYPLGARTVTVTGGRPLFPGSEAIAGSTLTMDGAFRNAVGFLGITVEEAVALTSTNSARLLDLDGRKGAIAPGLDADLLVLSERLGVEATMVAGQWLMGPH